MNHWVLLLIAIVAEVIATSALKASHGLSKPLPSLVVVCGYGFAFYALSSTLKSLPMGVSYAIWSGVGLALITLIDWMCFGQRLDIWAIFGMFLIISGVMVIYLLSNTTVQS